MIIAQGGAFAGWALYLHEGKPAYCYNLFGLAALQGLRRGAGPGGQHQVRMEFAYDGGGLAKGGDVTLYVDGEQVGRGPRRRDTVPMVFSADETTDLGSDTATPVSDDYRPQDSTFTGAVDWVQLDIGRGRRGPRPPDHPGGAPASRWRASRPACRRVSSTSRTPPRVRDRPWEFDQGLP